MGNPTSDLREVMAYLDARHPQIAEEVRQGTHLRTQSPALREDDPQDTRSNFVRLTDIASMGVGVVASVFLTAYLISNLADSATSGQRRIMLFLVGLTCLGLSTVFGDRRPGSPPWARRLSLFLGLASVGHLLTLLGIYFL